MFESIKIVMFVLLSECGGNFNATAGEQTITTPGWPGNYTSYLRCLWVINSDGANLIRMTFTEFDIELPSTPGNSYTCHKDFVIVKEDRAETRICGDKDQYLFKIYGNRTFYATSQLKIFFYTDNNDFYKGFQAIFTVGK